MSKMSPKVDDYIRKNQRWQEELEQLRAIVFDCGLNEEVKWNVPCYTLGGKNVVLIHVFKEYCALLFPKGALLDDTSGILIQQTENTQAARQIRFANVREIIELEPMVKARIHEAIEVEKAGLKVQLRETTQFSVPEELQTRLDEDPALSSAFEALTPGRQRAYLLYFSGAKQSNTRASRVERYVQHILEGKGLNDC